MKPLAASPGFTLIEILVVVAVLGIVLMIGLPNMSAWLQNTQIRNAAESASAGLQLARAEALRRNAAVRFSLVDTLTSSCALSASRSARTSAICWSASFSRDDSVSSWRLLSVTSPMRFASCSAMTRMN